MKFHGLMVVRDEQDIIPQTLGHLLTWVDALYVMDLGSTDGTWDIIQDLARSDSRVVPFFSKPIIFDDALRSILFDQFRDRFSPGDWVLRVDADEFYEILPPVFVAEQMRSSETAAWLQWYFFRLTRPEVEDYESGRVAVIEDRKRPIQDRRRFYKIPDYAEPRMFRYRRSMRWSEHATAPNNAGYVSRNRIPIRHYPHRDPLQMQQRYRLRLAMTHMGSINGPHWQLDDWRKEILDVEPGGRAIERTAPHEGLSAAQGHTSGELYEWIPGTPLPQVNSTSHLLRWPARSVQRVIHPLLLPMLDRRRQPFAKNYQPRLIPEEITRGLKQAREI